MSIMSCLNTEQNRKARTAGYELEGWLLMKGFQYQKDKGGWHQGSLTISFDPPRNQVTVRTSVGTEVQGRLTEIIITSEDITVSGKRFYTAPPEQSVI